MAIDPSNLASTPAGYQTPEQLQEQNVLARLLSKNAAGESPITSPWQGLQKMADAATAAYVRNKTGQGQQQGYDIFSRNVTGVQPPLTPPATPGWYQQNPSGTTPSGTASNPNPMSALFTQPPNPYSVG